MIDPIVPSQTVDILVVAVGLDSHPLQPLTGDIVGEVDGTLHPVPLAHGVASAHCHIGKAWVVTFTPLGTQVDDQLGAWVGWLSGWHLSIGGALKLVQCGRPGHDKWDEAALAAHVLAVDDCRWDWNMLIEDIQVRVKEV